MLERVVLEVEGELVADPGEVLLDLAGPVEAYLHVRQNIFRANAIEKVGPGEKMRKLIACATNEERCTCFMQTLREAFKNVDIQTG